MTSVFKVLVLVVLK